MFLPVAFGPVNVNVPPSKLDSHILHVYEDFNLPISDLFVLIEHIREGRLLDIQEKMDGQNFTFTVIADEIRQLSKGTSFQAASKGGSSRGTVYDKYSDRPHVQQAFMAAFDAAETLKRESAGLLNRVCVDGKVALECALLHPGCVNTIPYPHKELRLIAARVLSSEVTVDSSAYDALLTVATSIDLPNVPRMGPVPSLTMTPAGADGEFLDDLRTDLAHLVGLFGLESTNTVGELCTSLVAEHLTNLPIQIRQQAAHRLVTKEKSILTKAKVQKVASERAWTLFQVLEENRSLVLTEALIPLEQIIQTLGAIAFRHTQFQLASNERADAESLRRFVRQVRTAFNEDKLVATPDQLDRIRVCLKRLRSQMWLEKPVEGFVFKWRGQDRKLTGVFTALNQLNGYFKYATPLVRFK